MMMMMTATASPPPPPPATTSTDHHNHHHHVMPSKAVFLEGEVLVTPDSTSFPIILALSNNQTRGHLFITNFRLYFESSDDEDPPPSPPPPPTVASTAEQQPESKSPPSPSHHNNKMPNGIAGKNSSDEGGEQSSSPPPPPPPNVIVIDIPLCLIHRIEKLNEPSPTIAGGFLFQGILIICKNGRRLRFLKLPEQSQFDGKIHNLLDKYAFPISNGLSYFAFDYKPTQFAKGTDGWLVYSAESEYARQGVRESTHWRVNDINAQYQLCETYPSVLVTPKSASEYDLREIAKFRSKGRIPVLSWLSPAEVALMRSSQPLCGFSGKRSAKDEEYLRSIAAQQPNSSSAKGCLEIIDARPYLNAMANWTTGGGYEDEKYYVQCKIRFLQIDNIHAMRDSLNVSGDFFTNLENSRWLEHVSRVLDGASKIANILSVDKNSVLVHCSDGWDRTSQLTALAMLLLDKYYRTITGFEVLIEKEWLSFGHCYEMRMGHGSNKHSDNDRSPIFVQFIDCVWQIMNQNSSIFEFNQNFLLEILRNIYTCQYGTFLYNSEYDRHKNDVKSKTVSLWTYVNSNLELFTNKQYQEYDGSGQVKIDSGIAHLRIWTDYYFEYKELTDTFRFGEGASGSGATSGSSTSSMLQDGIDTVINNNVTSRIASGILTSGSRIASGIFNTVKSSLRN